MGCIIWLASYPKAGNTWVRTFVTNLVANRPEPVPFHEHSRFCPKESHVGWYQTLIEGDPSRIDIRKIAEVRPRAHELIAAQSEHNIFVKTHSANHKIGDYAQINKNVTSAAIYILRNPLDLVISYAAHFGHDLDAAINSISSTNNIGTNWNVGSKQVPELLSDWSSHVKSWTAIPNPRLHVIRYEDMLDQPEETFGNLAKFLGLDIQDDPARLSRAISFSSFDTLRQIEEKDGFAEKSPNAERFFRVGKKGQWRKVLSKQQIKRITDQHREQMERFGYA